MAHFILEHDHLYLKLTLNENRQNFGYLNLFCGENPFLRISHCVLCLDKNGERERKKINSEDIAGGLHITFCIKVRLNLALIIIPKDDSLEPLSLANPRENQTLTKTKDFESHCLLSALCFWIRISARWLWGYLDVYWSGHFKTSQNHSIT